MLKLRGFVSNVDGSPAPGRQIVLRSTGTADGDGAGPPLAWARTDRVGYFSISLEHLSKPVRDLLDATLRHGLRNGSRDLTIEVEDAATSRHLILTQAGLIKPRQAAPEPAARVRDGDEAVARTAPAEDAGSDDDRVKTIADFLFGSGQPLRLNAPNCLPEPDGRIGYVQDPDCIDYALSPESFVDRRPVIVGDDGCEHVLPARLPLQTYTIYRLHVRSDSATEPPEASATAAVETAGAGATIASEIGTGSIFAAVFGEGGAGGGGAAAPALADADADLAHFEGGIRVAQLFEFQQTWTSLGHSLGEVKYSLALAPGEAVRLAVVDWQREDRVSRTDKIREKERLTHLQTFDRDVDEVVSGNVSEQQGGFSHLAGTAGAMDVAFPQYGISGAGRHALGIGLSYSGGNRDMRADSQQDIHNTVVQRSNVVRNWNSTVVVQANQSEGNTLATRIVANMNRGHALSILYYEVLRHLCVETAFRREFRAALIPFKPFTFSAATTRRFRAQLKDFLIEPHYAAGFDALDRAAVGAYPADAGPAPQGSETGATTKIMVSDFSLEIRSGPGQQGDTWGSARVLLHLKDPAETVELFAKSYGSNNSFLSPQFRSIKTGDVTLTSYARSVPAFDIARLVRVGLWWKVSPNAVEVDYDGWDVAGIKIACEVREGGTRPRQHQLLDWTPPKVGPITFPRPVDITPDVGAPNATVARDVNSRLQTPVAITSSAGSISRGEAIAVKGSYRDQGLELSTTAFALPATAVPDEDEPEDEADPPPAGGSKPPTRAGDTALGAMLVDHLNANKFHYNALAWMRMDPRERRLRVAAVAGRMADALGDDVLAVVGNHLAFRYDDPQGEAAIPAEAGGPAPVRAIVTLPTRGVFAEAHLGHCNGAEQRDVTRFWNFGELPVSLLPNIEGLTPGPRGTGSTLGQPQLPASIVNIVAPPTVPDPAGVTAATDILGRSDIFRDMSALKEVSAMLGKLIEAAKPPTLGGAGSGAGAGTAGAGSGASPNDLAWAKSLVDGLMGGGQGTASPISLFDRLGVADEYAKGVKELGGTDEEALRRFQELMRGAVASADAGIGAAAPDAGTKELSGPQWVGRYPTSQVTDTLAVSFKTACDEFIAALQTAGATVGINATYRPPQRSYLMHYSWAVAEGADPSRVPQRDDVPIDWVHRDAQGKADLAKSKSMARQMVTAYGMTKQASLTTLHEEGLAIDMTIRWTGDLTIRNKDGDDVTISSTPRTGVNADLAPVGATYGVIKATFPGDPPHWSATGR